VTILAGTHSHGQGHATTYAQMAADWLGVPFDTIRFVQGDTDAVTFGRGTYAARSSLLGGCALKMAADAIVEKARALAAFLLEAAPADLQFANGVFSITGTDRALPLVEIAKAAYRPAGLPAQYLGLEASGSWAADPPNYPNGCHVAEVEIDPDTGRVSLARYAVVDDVGRIVNPMICEGQVHGALAQGIGQALLEDTVYDAASGQLVSASFMDYAMPRAADAPDFVFETRNVPCKTNPLGVKGAGEAGAIGSCPAVMNAVIDALDRAYGIRAIDMPATPQKVWTAIQSANQVAAE
jgi:aerobic carbon-monoxide dehydrogenase large subunit